MPLWTLHMCGHRSQGPLEGLKHRLASQRRWPEEHSQEGLFPRASQMALGGPQATEGWVRGHPSA